MKGKVSTIIFVNEKKEILLQLRDNKTSISYPNTWCSIGGHLEENESPIEALKREVKEEIDYNVKEPVFLGSFDDSVGNIVYVYLSKIKKDVRELELNEGQRLEYFNFKRVKTLNVPKPLKDFIFKHRAVIFS